MACVVVLVTMALAGWHFSPIVNLMVNSKCFPYTRNAFVSEYHAKCFAYYVSTKSVGMV